MGISIQTWDFLHEAMATAMAMNDGSQIAMCELGNQRFRGSLDVPTEKAKDYFEGIGIKHVSIDINGLDGSLKHNLAKPIYVESMMGRFDIVTNFGTSEHVSDQYECFKNMHNLCRHGGIFIHAVPKIGSWRRHCRFRYTMDFFHDLSSKCQYEPIILKEIKHPKKKGKKLICASMRKSFDVPFIPLDFFSMSGIDDASQ